MGEWETTDLPQKSWLPPPLTLHRARKRSFKFLGPISLEVPVRMCPGVIFQSQSSPKEARQSFTSSHTPGSTPIWAFAIPHTHSPYTHDFSAPQAYTHLQTSFFTSCRQMLSKSCSGHPFPHTPSPIILHSSTRLLSFKMLNKLKFLPIYKTSSFLGARVHNGEAKFVLSLLLLAPEIWHPIWHIHTFSQLLGWPLNQYDFNHFP